jgi:tRNA uridine 5-carboxymethylaminomethyl modification enzyme
VGLIGKERWARYQEKRALLKKIRETVTETKVEATPLSQLFKRPDFGAKDLPPEIRRLASDEIWNLIETDFKYEGYAVRQTEQNRKLTRATNQIIPDGLDFGRIAGLRSETRQRLAAVRPISLGQAARISGITPADLAIISIWLAKNSLRN